MQLSAYLSFDGQCEEAFRFYEKCLGGKIAMTMTYGESPMAGSVPAEWHKKILHVTLLVGNYRLMGADAWPEHYKKPQGFSVTIGVGEPAEVERIFQELAENGQILMPLEKTFWSERFGMLIDRFGTPWMINCEQPG